MGRRRCLRHQGVPVHGHGPAGLRRGHVPRRVHRGRVACGAVRRRPGRPSGAPREQQVRRRAGRGPGGRGRPDRRRLVRRDRSPRATAGSDAARTDRDTWSPPGSGPGHARGRGAHPRVHPYRPGRFEVRVRTGLGAATEAVDRLRDLHAKGVVEFVGHPRPPREPGVRPGPLRPGHRGAGRVLRPARPARTGGRRWTGRGLRQRRGSTAHGPVGRLGAPSLPARPASPTRSG